MLSLTGVSGVRAEGSVLRARARQRRAARHGRPGVAVGRCARPDDVRAVRSGAGAVITEQAEQLLELTTPVVKLWDGVVAVLIGTLDSARTQVVMEKLLQTLVDTGSEHAIIDITGVPAVDTEVAQHLLKTVVAARLMGAECIVRGSAPRSRRPSSRWASSSATSPRRRRSPTRCSGAAPARRRERPAAAQRNVDGAHPDLTLGENLLVSIQVELQDQTVLNLQDDLAEPVSNTGPPG